jgi:hypothetical protein
LRGAQLVEPSLGVGGDGLCHQLRGFDQSRIANILVGCTSPYGDFAAAGKVAGVDGC